MDTVSKYLEDLSGFIPRNEVINNAVSGAAVGWHIEHSLLTIRGIMARLLSSDEKDYKSSFMMSKVIVMTFGFIPRGRARSPKAVTPDESPDAAKLYSSLEETRQALQDLHKVARNQYFDHPIFGHMNKKAAEKFLSIHTGHHLKIIRDILR